MFWNRNKTEQKKIQKRKREEAYNRVLELHSSALFLFYVEEAYREEFDGKTSMKLLGIVALGAGTVEDTFILYNCQGIKKGVVHIDEFYLGADSVKQLEGGDKRVAIYPLEQDLSYVAGDILCKMNSE